jgi:hypothetical protein
MITVEEAASRLYLCWALTRGRPWPGGCKLKVRPPDIVWTAKMLSSRVTMHRRDGRMKAKQLSFDFDESSPMPRG